MGALDSEALRIGQLFEKVTQGYFSFVTVLEILRDERSNNLLPEVLPGEIIPVGQVFNNEGFGITFDFRHFLNAAKSDPFFLSEFEQSWLRGGIILLADELDKNNYFDRAPELELIRHIRNGIAHGNHFNITKPQQLQKYPANNHLAWIKQELIEITPQCHGQKVLFDFISPINLVNLLYAIGLYLIRKGNGDDTRP